jgi:hypothetical protein
VPPRRETVASLQQTYPLAWKFLQQYRCVDWRGRPRRVGLAADNLIATLNKRRSAARSPTTFSAEKNLLSVSPG